MAERTWVIGHIKIVAAAELRTWMLVLGVSLNGSVMLGLGPVIVTVEWLE